MLNEDDIKQSNIADYFLSNLEKLNQITKNEINVLMSMCCEIINMDKSKELKNKYLTILYEITFIDNITLEECWHIYWLIVSALFKNAEL